MSFQTTPENLRIVAAIEKILAAVSMGSSVTYAELNRAARIDVRGRRDLLYRAVKRVEKDLGCIFGAVRNIGMKRLMADDTPQVGSLAIKKTRRTAKKAMTRMSNVNSNSMSTAARHMTVQKIQHCSFIADNSDNRKTATLFPPVTADPFAAQKAANGLREKG